MRTIAVIASLIVGGCFSPDFEGTMCSTQGECPDGFTCGGDNRCHAAGAVDASNPPDADPNAPDADPNAPDSMPRPDAAVDAAVIDAPIDGPPIDAPIDAGPIACTLSTLGADQVTQSGGVCYARYATRLAWTAARDQCASRGGHLVTIASGIELNTVASLKNNNQAVWIGLFTNGGPGQVQWVTGEPVSFTSWQTGEPDMSSSCTRQGSTTGGAQSFWYDDSCTVSFEYICEFND